MGGGSGGGRGGVCDWDEKPGKEGWNYVSKKNWTGTGNNGGQEI